MDLFPLFNSLRISLIATLITLVTGILAAYFVARLSGAVKGILDTLLTIPMVLPPTVVGFLLLMLISPKSFLGQILKSYFDLTLTMNWYSAIFAVTIVTFPLMYRTVRAAFEAFDQNLLYAGQTLGLSDRFIFLKILLPNCKSGIIAGVVLAFARGLGEYGATSMVAGYIAGRTATVSTTVAYYWQIGLDGPAVFWVIVNLVISFAVMLTVNFYEKRRPVRKEAA